MITIFSLIFLVQRAAYEWLRNLVGAEMSRRDRPSAGLPARILHGYAWLFAACPLYTIDAAAESSGVYISGRRSL